MNKQKRVSHPVYSCLQAEVRGFEPLAEPALDMCRSWNHADDEIQQQLDTALWGPTHNRSVVLRPVL
jgi:hypothetical protein